MADRTWNVVITREGGRHPFTALCPELNIASQGKTVEQAKSRLHDAIELFFETASPEEIRHRVPPEVGKNDRPSEAYLTSLTASIPSRAARVTVG